MTTKIFSIALLCLCSAIQTWATSVDIGNDRVIGDGSSITLHADISIEGLRQEEYPIKWYKRLYTQTDYEATPFAEGTGTEVTLNNLTETTYIKVTVGDVLGTTCWDEMKIVVAKLYKVGFADHTPIYIDPTSPTAAPDVYVSGAFPVNAHYIKAASGSVVSKPVCYTRNTAPRVQVMITGNDLTPDLMATLKIKASLSGTSIAGAGYNATLPATAVVQMNSGSTSGYGYAAPITATAPLPNQIDIIEPLVIDWEISDDVGVNWTNMTNSTPTQHQIYVTLGTPVMTFANQFLFRTTLDISCRQAKGLPIGDVNYIAVSDKIYEAFKNQTITKLNGTPLKYWGAVTLNPPPGVYIDETRKLLYYNEGPCNTWAKFFMDMLKVQGFTNGNGNYQYEAISLEYGTSGNETLEGNLLTSFNTAKSTLVGAITDGKGENTQMAPVALLFINNFNTIANSFYQINGGYPGVIVNYPVNSPPVIADQTGLPAQNNSDPLAIFNNHAIVKVGHANDNSDNCEGNYRYYDPSYGSLYHNADGSYTTFRCLKQWEETSLKGIGSMLCVGVVPGAGCYFANGAANKLLWFGLANTVNKDLQEGTSTY